MSVCRVSEPWCFGRLPPADWRVVVLFWRILAVLLRIEADLCSVFVAELTQLTVFQYPLFMLPVFQELETLHVLGFPVSKFPGQLIHSLPTKLRS